MPMIDADTHVDECEDTWKKLEGTPYAKYIPVTIAMPPDEAKRADCRKKCQGAIHGPTHGQFQRQLRRITKHN